MSRIANSQPNSTHNPQQQQRSYHTSSTSIDTSNDFFSPQSKVQTRNPSASNNINNNNFKQSQQFNNSASNGTQSSANPTVCYCGASALLLTVRKEGPNQGKQFYSCANNRQCEFFSWFDAATTSNNSPSDSHNSHRAANSPFNQRRNASSPPSSNRQNKFGSSSYQPSNASGNKCECGLEAKLYFTFFYFCFLKF